VEGSACSKQRVCQIRKAADGLRSRARADPGSWQIDPSTAGDFANIFVYARAQIANKIGKPWILEETGMEARPRPTCSAAYQGKPRLS
jgi:hypothetical protein